MNHEDNRLKSGSIDTISEHLESVVADIEATNEPVVILRKLRPVAAVLSYQQLHQLWVMKGLLSRIEVALNTLLRQPLTRGGFRDTYEICAAIHALQNPVEPTPNPR